jgi:hypothetical protein
MPDKFNDYGWKRFHDVVFNISKLRCTRKRLEEIFEQLPEHLKAAASEWGLDDCVILDKIYTWLKGNLPLIK